MLSFGSIRRDVWGAFHLQKGRRGLVPRLVFQPPRTGETDPGLLSVSIRPCTPAWFSREISYDGLAARAGVSSPHTLQTYVGYLSESYLVSLVRRYSTRPAERIRNDKLYVNDPAFISYFTGLLGSEEELGWRLENIVYLELLSRGGLSPSRYSYG